MITGIASDVVRNLVDQLPVMALAARINPTTRLPVSPINMRARGKLCFRKPSEAPPRANATNAIFI